MVQYSCLISVVFVRLLTHDNCDLILETNQVVTFGISRNTYFKIEATAVHLC